MKDNYKCGRITVNKVEKTWYECNNNANWKSPERLRTTGKLKVCDFHEQEMKEEYRKEGRRVEFAPI